MQIRKEQKDSQSITEIITKILSSQSHILVQDLAHYFQQPKPMLIKYGFTHPETTVVTVAILFKVSDQSQTIPKLESSMMTMAQMMRRITREDGIKKNVAYLEPIGVKREELSMEEFESFAKKQRKRKEGKISQIQRRITSSKKAFPNIGNIKQEKGKGKDESVQIIQCSRKDVTTANIKKVAAKQIPRINSKKHDIKQTASHSNLQKQSIKDSLNSKKRLKLMFVDESASNSFEERCLSLSNQPKNSQGQILRLQKKQSLEKQKDKSTSFSHHSLKIENERQKKGVSKSKGKKKGRLMSNENLKNNTRLDQFFKPQ